MSKKDETCENCRHWMPHHDGFGDCCAVITARLITQRWHRCCGERIKFKPKKVKDE